MKRMKRLVALLIALTTIASLCVFSLNVSAEEVVAAPTYDASEETLLVEKLEALGLISNEYEPSDYTTRRQMSNIICDFMNLSVAGSSAEKSPFRDVPVKDPDFAAIKTLFDLGIVTGDGQLGFYPDDELTYDQAVVFIVNAIGYNSFAMRDGGYPTGYHRVAIQHGMLKGLSMQSGSDPVPVIDVYKMLEAAMNAATIIPVYGGDDKITYTLSSTETFLSSVYGIKKYRGIVSGNCYTNPELTDEQIEIADGQYNNAKIYDTPGYYYDYMLGYRVDYYLELSPSYSELVYIEETKRANSVEKVDSDDILFNKITSDRIYYKDDLKPKEEYHIDYAGCKYVYNNQYIGYGPLTGILSSAFSGYIEALDNTGDGECDVLFVYEYVNYVIDALDRYNEKFRDELTNTDISLDSTEQKISIKLVGETKRLTFKELAIGDVLSVYKSRGTDPVTFVTVSRKTADGQITGYDSELGYEISGTYYEIAAGIPLVINVGDTGSFFLDMNNDIVKFGYTSASDLEVGLLQGIDYKVSVISQEASVRIFTTLGEFKEFDLAEKIKINTTIKDTTDSVQLNSAFSLLGATIPAGSTQYAIETPCLVKYKVVDGKITAFETVVNTDENYQKGKMCSIVYTGEDDGGTSHVSGAKYNYVCVRGNGMLELSLNGWSNPERSVKYTAKQTVVFGVPTNVSEIDKYRIISSLNQDTDLHSSGKIPVTDGVYVYGLGGTEIPVADVMILRGADKGAAVSDSTGIDVVTKISDALDADGMAAKKVYFGEGRSFLLTKDVEIQKKDVYGLSGEERINVTVNDLLTNHLNVGSVVQCQVDAQGVITAVKFVAEYASGVLSPLYQATYTNKGTESQVKVEKDYTKAPYGGTSLVMIAEVVEYDVENGIMTVDVETRTITGLTSPTTDVTTKRWQLYATEKVEARRYIEDKEKLITVMNTDIKQGDKIIVNLTQNFTCTSMLLFD